MSRTYYSQRLGVTSPSARLTLPELKEYVAVAYSDWEKQGFFQEFLGYDCVDAGFVPGLTGSRPNIELKVTLRKDHLWPLADTIADWSEEDLFDVLEFLFDRISKPLEGYHHRYNHCGWHYSTFNQEEGQTIYRTKLNRVLNAYDTGFELAEAGEILALGEPGLLPLLEASLPEATPATVVQGVEAAIRKFRRHRASTDNQLDAVRDLAGVLEFLRPQVKGFFDKDEQDLFNIANNFSIRHNTPSQKRNYDTPIWYEWIFYYYLNTVHATLRMLNREQ